MRNDPVEAALAEVAQLRLAPDPATLSAAITRALKNPVNLVVARAAQVAGELAVLQAMPDLVATFERLMKDPAKRDKTCAGTTAIITALNAMDYPEPDVFLRGIRHVQMEGSFGPPVDAAAKLRAECALGLGRTLYARAAEELVRLLADKEALPRIGAVRALTARGDQAAALLLRLKVLTGDPDPDVLAECFAGLLSVERDEAIEIVGSYAEHDDLEVAAVALLALGQSRLNAAFEFLKAQWEHGARSDLRKAMLAAFVALRSEAAVAFLLEIVEGAPASVAREVLEAMQRFRGNEKVREQIEEVVEQRAELRESYRQLFGE